MIKKLLNFFNSKALNIIILINILIFIIANIIILNLSSILFVKFIFTFTLNKDWENVIRLPFSIFTFGFIHKNIEHIFGNMLFLLMYYALIRKLEYRKIWELFLLGTICGGIAWFIVNLFLIDQTLVLLGSSCGIMALITYVCLKFKDIYLINWNILKFKVIYLLLIHILMISVNIYENINLGGEISHIGGFLLGVFYYFKESKIKNTISE